MLAAPLMCWLHLLKRMKKMAPLNILIIDLKGPFNQVARHFLSTLQLVDEVMLSDDAEQALRITRQLQPQIIFLNPVFAGGDTPELCRRLKKVAAGTKIIGLTVFKALLFDSNAGTACFDGYVSRENFGDDVLTLVESLKAFQGQGEEGKV